MNIEINMKQFLKCLKENLEKLRNSYNRGPSLSRPFEKIDWIPFLLSIFILLITMLAIWVIFSPIIHFIKMRASG